ncbi:MAG: 30S ribosome-binding factor RbfA [Candidatus Promineofilum sp.]|nr:30S ribosome-binding factor RbfA [Promineifilum sp.]MCW5865198.1 30S ribosome-binding factor RbfA [Anaerolineae bacterium]
MSKIRQERTAELIQQLLSEMFLREVNDPRLAGVTITEVQIDRELQYATAYVNALGDDSRREEVMAGLQSAAGFLRRELAQSLDLRSAPILRFEWDPRLRYVEEVDELLDELDIKPEEAVAASAALMAAATPAGDLSSADAGDEEE